MKEYLLQNDGRYIECELDGLKMTYTCSDDPKSHYEVKLRDRNSYPMLKNMIQEIYHSTENSSDAYWDVCDFLHSTDCEGLIEDGGRFLHQDMRDKDEILAYEEEACDKVWFMRARPGQCPDGIKRIFEKYDDIPREGYTDWECGYWNGIMGALRWVMGEEKDFLDT